MLLLYIRVAPDWYWRRMVAGGFQQGEVDNESYLFTDTAMGIADRRISYAGSNGFVRVLI